MIGELIKYPEVFFIRDVPTSDNAFETIVELNPAYRYVKPFSFDDDIDDAIVAGTMRNVLSKWT